MDNEAESLRTHGYHGEAASVQKKADKNRLKAQKQFDRDFRRKWVESYNSTAYKMKRELEEINKKYEGSEYGKKYIKEVGKRWTDVYTKHLLSDFGTEPINNGKEYVKRAPFMNQYARYYNEKYGGSIDD